MERITSKLMKGIIVTLLFAAAVATASSQANQVDLNALAARGKVIANADPLAVALRNQQPEGPAGRSPRHGFDIGMGAAEGDTLPGPGKDRICSSLPPAAQGGCSIAVSFSVERNRNAKLASTGAAIAKVDPIVAKARNVETDVFYLLGFDIATGLFGDPALGTQGNTALGPGSLRIRDSLSGGGQKGFNASVILHLSRTYKRLPGGAGAYDPNAVVTPIGGKAGNAGTSAMGKEILKAPFISDVQVRPDSRNVVISFASTQSTPPLVEISKVAPRPDRGILTFAFDSGAFSRFAPLEKGRYSVDVDVQQEQLDIGTTYYYIINVFNDNKNDAKRPREQVSGKFTTTSQDVLVMWDTILVEDDSDDASTGEIIFGFWANYGQPREAFAKYENRDMDSGHNYYPGQALTIQNAPDHLTLSVRGQEDDGDGGPNPFMDKRPCSGPGDTDYPYVFDVNGADGVFDLSQYPGTKVSIPFRLNSKPHGALRFVIFGRIEITRPKP